MSAMIVCQGCREPTPHVFVTTVANGAAKDLIFACDHCGTRRAWGREVNYETGKALREQRLEGLRHLDSVAQKA